MGLVGMGKESGFGHCVENEGGREWYLFRKLDYVRFLSEGARFGGCLFGIFCVSRVLVWVLCLESLGPTVPFLAVLVPGRNLDQVINSRPHINKIGVIIPDGFKVDEEVVDRITFKIRY